MGQASLLRPSVSHQTLATGSSAALGPSGRTAADRRTASGKLADVDERPSGWHGYRPPPPIEVSASGGAVDSELAPDGHRFELSIYESPTGFRLLIIDWTDGSQMDSDHPSLDEARQHAASLVQDRSLNWAPWSPPGEDA
jgi:hypothetical protein